jgi:hypothetical protein
MTRTALFSSLVAIGLAATAIAATPKANLSAVKAQMRTEVRSEGHSPVGRHTTASSATVHTAAGPTAADVGDADTFGRTVIWDGIISSGNISMAADCTPAPGDPPPGPDDHCITLNPAPAATSFDLPDIGRITLPAKSSRDILCHWLTPIVIYSLHNGTGVPATGRISLSPYLKVESSVLNDPSLIDLTTGLPFNGSLITAFSANYQSSHTLQPGDTDTERFSESRVCIGGTISRQGLIQGYGLTNAQVDKFFANPMTLRLGLRGSATLVDFANLIYAVRIMGD